MKYNFRYVFRYLKSKFSKSTQRVFRKYYLRNDKLRTIVVDPKNIVFRQKKPEFLITDKTEIRNGDWDKDFRIFSESVLFYNSLKERISGKEWEQTAYYKDNLANLDSGRWGLKSVEDLNKRLEKLDELYLAIKNKGYNYQGGKDGLIGVNITRTGSIIFNNGRHRLSIVKLLKLPKIKVIVNNVHLEWELFRHEILDYAKRAGGAVYAPLLHPDLSGIKSVHGSDRWSLIESSIQSQEGSVLDIGCHWGYFSYLFEQKGFNVTAVEIAPESFSFLNRIRDSIGSDIRTINTNIFELNDVKYDVLIALSIFHHFLKTEKLYNNFIKFLNRIDSKEMIFQPHNAKEAQMQNVFKNFESIQFVEFIIEHSCYTNYEYLGKCIKGRALYRIYVE